MVSRKHRLPSLKKKHLIQNGNGETNLILRSGFRKHYIIQRGKKKYGEKLNKHLQKKDYLRKILKSLKISLSVNGISLKAGIGEY